MKQRIFHPMVHSGFPIWLQDTKNLGPSFLLSQAYQQGAGSRVEQPELKLIPLWHPNTASKGSTYNATASTPFQQLCCIQNSHGVYIHSSFQQSPNSYFVYVPELVYKKLHKTDHSHNSLHSTSTTQSTKQKLGLLGSHARTSGIHRHPHLL